MNLIKELLKEKGKARDVFFQSLAWMLVSMVASYPEFCIKHSLDMFHVATKEEYCQVFLLPIMWFLLAFILDFFFSIKDLSIGQKRGDLFKVLTILLCTMIFTFCLITVISDSCVFIKVVLFLLLWMNISLIKGLTVLIPGADDVVTLETPINNLNKS